MKKWINKKHVILAVVCLLMAAVFMIIRLNESTKVSVSKEKDKASISRITSEKLNSFTVFCALDESYVVYTHPFGEELNRKFYFLNEKGELSEAPYVLDRFEKITELFSDSNQNLCMLISKANDKIVKVFDVSGACICEFNLTEVIKENIISVRRNENGYFYALASDEDMSTLYIFDEQKKLIKKITGLLSTQGCLRKVKAGEIVYISMTEKDNSSGVQFNAKIYDDAQEVGEYVLPVSNTQGFDAFADGAFYDLYYCDSSYQIYGYDLKKGESVIVADLYAMGMNAAEMSGYGILKQSDLLVEINHFDKKGFWDKNELYQMKLGKMQAERSHIVLASVYADGRIQEAVMQFNAANEDTYIEVKDYSGYQDPRKQLVLDLMSGVNIDIIHINNEVEHQLIEKNVLTDLYPYIKDCGLQSGLNQNILRLLSSNGKLFSLCPTYSIDGMIQSKEQTLGESGLNINHLVKTQIQNKLFIADKSPQQLLERFLANNYSYFIDYEAKSCKFHSKEFSDLLELSQSLADKRLEYSKDYSVIEFIREGIATGKTLGVDFRNSDFDILNFQLFSDFYKGEVEVVSYPSFEPQGVGFIPGIQYGICETSKHKEEAWNFIEMQFLRQNQLYEAGAGNIPMVLECLEEYLKRMTTIDGYMDGKQQFIEPVSEILKIGEGEIKLQPATLEEAENFRKVIDSIDHRVVMNEAVFEIVQEEAKYYYDKIRTAEEVGVILQDRISILLNE